MTRSNEVRRCKKSKMMSCTWRSCCTGLSSGLIVSIKPKAGADMGVKSRNGARWSRLSGSRK
jgi:hypothetical protein